MSERTHIYTVNVRRSSAEWMRVVTANSMASAEAVAKEFTDDGATVCINVYQHVDFHIRHPKDDDAES